MDEFGSITIDNKNLLDDLLGLNDMTTLNGTSGLGNGNNSNNLGNDYDSGYFLNKRSQFLNHTNQSSLKPSFNGKYGHQSNFAPTQSSQPSRFYLESPTFTKAEDDIYRYVHSRISNVDPVTSRERDNHFYDSLAENVEEETNRYINYTKNSTSNNNNNNNNNNYNKSQTNVSNTNPNSTTTAPAATTTNAQPTRINSNRLLSDLAVASLPKRDSIQNNINQSNILQRQNLDDQLYDNDLILDSLDLSTKYAQNYSQTQQQPQQQTQYPLQQPRGSQSILDNQFNLQQQQHQQQQQQQQQHQQYQPTILPIQTIQPIPQGVFVLPSPTGNAIPLVNTSLQFHQSPTQFIPIQAATTSTTSNPAAVAAQQQAAMYYQEPIQPMFYNTAYPINIPFPPPNAAANAYYAADPYQTNQLQQPNPYQYQTNDNGFFSGGSRYDAQPLQPPPVPPPRVRNQANNNNNNSQQNHQNRNQQLLMQQQQQQDAYDGNSQDDDNEMLNNEFNSLRVNGGGGGAGDFIDDEDEESRGQKVWAKLQKARETKDKNSGGSRKKMPQNTSNNSLHSMSSPAAMSNNKSTFKKPPLPDNNNNNRKGDSNFLERNIEAIRNKENLQHRYPEKKYELMHSKNLGKSPSQNNNKKPPHHLQPLDNYDDDNGMENGYMDPYDTKKISIPLDTSKFKDKDHINVDINLRLIDFMPHSNGANNRSLDDFDDSPYAATRPIKQFNPTNMSRSLPGSSGSLNKFKPLPPLNNQQKYVNKPYSHQDTRLQHEYDSENRSEDGYLAQLQKSHMKKPVIKTYSIKDYRNFKKDAISTTNNTTGKLGFDFDNEDFKKKSEIAQKKVDYAERVKVRNRILIAEQKRLEETSSIRSPVQPPSKTQRAKEYVKNTVLRVRSASQSMEGGVDGESETRDAKLAPRKVAANNGQMLNEKKRAMNEQQQQQKQQTPLDLNKTREKPNDTAVVRIRDPVTSKVKTIYLNDSQIEELSKRHEQDKSKVTSMTNGTSNGNATTTTKTNAMQSNLIKPRQPINLGDQRDLISDMEPNGNGNGNSNYASNNQSLRGTPNNDIKTYRLNEKPVKAAEKEAEKETIIYVDEKMDRLLERHKTEKKKVEDFHDSPYYADDVKAANY